MNQVVTALFLIFLSSSSIGQTILKATKQDWAGGVCCISGTNYSLVFNLPKSVKTLEVDSVYLQTYGWVPSTLHPEYLVDKQRRVNLSFSLRRDENSPYLYNEVLEQPNFRRFDGAALIILKVNGKRVEKTIASFEELMFLVYP